MRDKLFNLAKIFSLGVYLVLCVLVIIVASHTGYTFLIVNYTGFIDLCLKLGLVIFLLIALITIGILVFKLIDVVFFNDELL